MNRLSDATLNGMTKKQIINYVRMYEHNYDVAEETLRQQAENVKDWRPVKRGHWIIEKEEPMYGGHSKIWALHCSECRKDPIEHIGGGFSNWWFQTPEFCPVCGAKMELEGMTNE